VRAPKERRSLDEIVNDAIEVIRKQPRQGTAPRHLSSGSIEAFRKLMKDCVSALQQVKDHPQLFRERSPAEKKKRWGDYANLLLHRTRKAAVAIHQWNGHMHPWTGEFISKLDEEIRLAERLRDFDLVNGRVVRLLKRTVKVDYVGGWATHMARVVMDPQHLSACPWRCTPTLTADGTWYRLSALLYEAVTGVHDRDLSRYCRKDDRSRPAEWFERPKTEPPESEIERALRLFEETGDRSALRKLLPRRRG